MKKLFTLFALFVMAIVSINSSLKNQYSAKRLSRIAKEFFENVIN